MDGEDALSLAASRAVTFRDRLPLRPQRPLQDFAASRALFAGPLPEEGLEASACIGDLANRAEPGLHAKVGDRFFGWVIGGSHPVGVAADWLTSAWGQNAGNHQASPAAAAAEAVAAGWLLELLDLPRQSSVGFVTGATVANFVCLAAARGEVLRGTGWDVEADGLFGAPPITVLIGDDAHTTVFSAMQFLGLGHERVVRIATDDQGRMLPSSFLDATRGVTGPCIAVLQAGQLNTGAFDGFAEIVPMARSVGAWVHVDAAFGAWARVSPRHRHLAEGLDLADSWATDGHKWLQTPYDCGYAIVRDEAAHRRAMTIAASYLPVTATGERDPSHLVPELSRRARGFATWAMIRHLGRRGIREMVERHCAVAARMADRLRAEPGIGIVNEVVLNQVLVRFGGDRGDEAGDALTRRTIARIQADGALFAGGAAWHGRQVMRLSVISWLIDETAGMAAAEAIVAAWRAVRETA